MVCDCNWMRTLFTDEKINNRLIFNTETYETSKN